MVPISYLDVVPISEGGNARTALLSSVALAVRLEELGFHRVWYAEHHNTPGVGSTAPAILVAKVASETSRIRVGAGGVILSNHPPLIVAEQFGTLKALFGDRIDLGLVRADPVDEITARALRFGHAGPPDRHGDAVLELERLIESASACTVPTQGEPSLRPEMWVLGSSRFSARLAADRGTPFAIASHLTTRELDDTLAVYRQNFRPSAWFDRPHVMVAVNVIAAETRQDALRIYSSTALIAVNSYDQRRRPLPAPVESSELNEIYARDASSRAIVVGDPDHIQGELGRILAATAADELIITCETHFDDARWRSLALTQSAISRLERQ